jgi:hypothetical protein
MAVEAGYSKIATSGSVFIYDTGDTINSYAGEPTTNYVPSPYNYSLYAYASGPVDVSTVDQNGNAITAKRYTITNAINTARAAIFPVTTTNTYYTFSFKWRYNGSTTATPSVGVSASKGNPETNNNTFNSQDTTTTSIGNGWYFTVYTFNFATNPTGGCILTFGINTGSTASYVNETFDIYQAQFEIKSHATPWANGTRSNTQGLLDISGGGNSINLANMSYDANAMMYFDGTDDYISLSTNSNLLNLGSTFTIEGILKLTNTSQELGVIFSSLDVALSSQTKGVGFYWYRDAAYGMNANTIRLQLGITAWAWHIFASNGITITNTNYHHVAVTLIGGDTSNPTIIFYIDGVAQSGTLWNAGSTGPINNSSNVNSLRLGSIYTATSPGYQTQYSTENLPVVKIYNRALSASEVLSNYNHYRTRFNII